VSVGTRHLLSPAPAEDQLDAVSLGQLPPRRALEITVARTTGGADDSQQSRRGAELVCCVGSLCCHFSALQSGGVRSRFAANKHAQREKKAPNPLQGRRLNN
jgi:hypothetical protein